MAAPKKGGEEETENEISFLREKKKQEHHLNRDKTVSREFNVNRLVEPNKILLTYIQVVDFVEYSDATQQGPTIWLKIFGLKIRRYHIFQNVESLKNNCLSTNFSKCFEVRAHPFKC